MPDDRAIWLRHAAFVLRCAAAATLAFWLSALAGLRYPVWAAMSAVIVSQEKLYDTNRTTLWRLAGTLGGIVSAVVAGLVLLPLASGQAPRIAAGVGLAAILVRLKPDLRVAMWTAPVVMLTQAPGQSLLATGCWRGLEVLLGGLAGMACHILAERLLRLAGVTTPGPPADGGNHPQAHE